MELMSVYRASTELHNHNRTVFEEMTSWIALTWYIEMKTDQTYQKQICLDFYYDDFLFS